MPVQQMPPLRPRPGRILGIPERRIGGDVDQYLTPPAFSETREPRLWTGALQRSRGARLRVVRQLCPADQGKCNESLLQPPYIGETGVVPGSADPCGLAANATVPLTRFQVTLIPSVVEHGEADPIPWAAIASVTLLTATRVPRTSSLRDFAKYAQHSARSLGPGGAAQGGDKGGTAVVHQPFNSADNTRPATSRRGQSRAVDGLALRGVRCGGHVCARRTRTDARSWCHWRGG